MVFRPGNSRLIAIFITTLFWGYVGVMILVERLDLYQPSLRWENLFALIPVLFLLTLFCFLKRILCLIVTRKKPVKNGELCCTFGRVCGMVGTVLIDRTKWVYRIVMPPLSSMNCR